MADWVHRYLYLAQHVSTWSKDPSTKCGAVAIGIDGNPLAHSYNGFPRGINDISERLNEREEKYKFIVHAEMNTIYNASLSGISLKGSSLYVWGLPVCSECAKGIIQVGIARVFMAYPNEISQKWKDAFDVTATMFSEAGLPYSCYEFGPDFVISEKPSRTSWTDTLNRSLSVNKKHDAA